jgi:acyl carrier protein
VWSEERLKSVVAAMLDVDETSIGEGTSTDTVKHWDSLHHMKLVIALEEEFDITIPDEDVATMTSYPIIRAVMQEQMGDAEAQ